MAGILACNVFGGFHNCVTDHHETLAERQINYTIACLH